MQPQASAASLPYSLDLARLSAAYDAGTSTPSAVIADVLAFIETARDSNPVWIYVLPRDALLRRAADLERRRAGGERLPLYGVPFAVKDNIDLEGHPTTAACPAYSYVPERTAHAVQRLEQAGAICVGKTNMDQFATGLVGTRSPYGACVNPFDSRYISGGSSSGSAVAVALGQVSFALGSDTAGSGRVPAGFCNIVGLKPTRGLVSTTGVVPACRSLDCVSIFAATAEDAASVLDIARGQDETDPYSRPGPYVAGSHGAASIRCGVPRAADLRFFGDDAAQRAFARALETLQSLGAELVEIDYTPFAETARLLYEGPWLAERLAAIAPFFDAFSDSMNPVVRDIIGGGARFSAIDAFEAQYRLQHLAKACAQAWQQMDMLVVPTAGTIYRVDEVQAEPIELNSRLGYYTNFVNLLDLSALAVPAAFREDGLPFGVTLIAPALQEATLVQWGSRFHRAAASRIGATSFSLPEKRVAAADAITRRAGVARRDDDGGRRATPALRAAAVADVTLAVVGAHLSGMPLNHQLTSCGARLLETCSTAPRYRLYALPDTVPPKPGLARSLNGSGTTIEVELWSVPVDAFGSFVATVPTPLAIGTVTLADGREVKGFVCEGYALSGARDISGFGGWRSFVEKNQRAHNEETPERSP